LKKWLVTDTHFNHENIRNGKLSSVRPMDYQDQIINNWKSMVGADDTVYHMGDVIFARRWELKDIIHDLPGIKILIRGNHDLYDIGSKKKNINPDPDFYIDAGFIAVVEAIMERNFILLSHAPVMLSPDIKLNIHGHFHDNPQRHWEPWYQDIIAKGKCRHRLLACEYEDYKPVLLEDFVRRG